MNRRDFLKTLGLALSALALQKVRANKRKSPELIPTISRNDAYRAYADALERSIETLTKAEKQAAFLNHIMERLDQPLERSE